MDNRELLNAATPTWTTIIGVIADARTESLADAATPQIYRSIYQHPSKDLAIFLRGQLDAATILEQERNQIQAVDPGLPVFRAVKLEEVLSTSLSVRRFSMEMVALFAGTALLLAALGIDGTISYLVSEKRDRHPPSPRSSKKQYPSDGPAPRTWDGSDGNLSGYRRCAHRLSSNGRLDVRGVPTDVPTFVGVSLVLTTVAFAASFFPALRATRVDPNAILHSE